MRNVRSMIGSLRFKLARRASEGHRGSPHGFPRWRVGLVWLFLLGAAIGRAEETDQITALTVEQAKTLAQDKSGRLLLDGLTSLSPEVATELARHEGWLSLNRLDNLSDEAAEALGRHKGYLHLDGLRKISDQAALALARHNGELFLNGLTSISDEAAKGLGQHRGGRLSL